MAKLSRVWGTWLLAVSLGATFVLYAGSGTPARGQAQPDVAAVGQGNSSAAFLISPTDRHQAAVMPRRSGLLQKDGAVPIGTYLDRLVAGNLFSGSVLVARGSTVLFVKGYGMADRARNVDNTPRTAFRIGNLTQQFTAAAILLLQEQRKLHVGDQACRYIVACPKTWQRITIRQLLTHTSGLPDYTAAVDFGTKKSVRMAPAKVLGLFKNMPLTFAPGKGFGYSNSNYIVLGVIIAKVAGQSYGRFLQRSIFQRLHMMNTGYEGDGFQPAFRATGYADNFGDADPVDPSVLYASAGLYSTVEDLYRWNQALYTGKLISASDLTQMLLPSISFCGQDCGISYTDLGYGYGNLLARDSTGRRIVSNGLFGAFWTDGLPGFTAFLGYYPGDQVSIIMLCNLQSVGTDAISSELSAVAFGARSSQ